MDALLAELRLERDRLLVLIRAYKNILKLDISAEAKADTQDRLATVDAPYVLIVAAVRAMEALMDHGYPVMAPPEQLKASVEADLSDKISGMNKAFSDITGDPEDGAVVIGISAEDQAALDQLSERARAVTENLEALDEMTPSPDLNMTDAKYAAVIRGGSV
jgi:hypothetical protein